MADIEEELKALGFFEGSNYEIILTTLNSNGSSNAAPMGATMTGPSTLEIKPFKTSTTYKNLKSRCRACVNVTSDSGIYLATSFKWEDLPGFPVPYIDGELRLDNSDAYVFIESESIYESEHRATFICRINSVEVINSKPRVFSRGRACAIEAIIHATRIKMFLEEGPRERVESLIKRFCECKDIVERVSSPESTDSIVIGELERLIGDWRKGTFR
jgi:hypothetical protein